MSAAEFREWVAFDQVEPLPDIYWASAMQALVNARIWGAKSATLADFLPSRGRPSKARQSNQLIRGLMSSFAARQNAAVARTKA